MSSKSKNLKKNINIHCSDKKYYIESYDDTTDEDSEEIKEEDCNIHKNKNYKIINSKKKNIITELINDSDSDSEYIIKPYKKNDHNDDVNMLKYFIKNKNYKKISNYYEINLKYNCDKPEILINSIILLKNILKKKSDGRIIIFYQKEK